MEKLSVIMLSKDKASMIGKCLAALDFADEIIIVDDYSKDKTVEICKKFGCRVFQHKFVDFEQQTNFALSKASNEWVFWLDADQVVSKELKENIKSALKDNRGIDGFLVKGQTVFLEKLTRFGGETCYLLRLFKKSKTRFVGKIHEQAIVQGNIGKLDGVLLHYQYRDVGELFRKVGIYSSIEAELMRKGGKSFNLILFLFWPPASFCWRYFFLFGFLDGWRGLLLSVAAFLYRLKTQLKLLKASA